jgi:excinuclease UvrABC helicase subunit UvrB
MTEMYRDMKSPSGPTSLKDIIKDMGKDGSITITNLNTGETSTTDLGEVNGMSDFSKMILKSMIDGALRKDGAATSKSENKTREQLEEELAKAVSNDDFETAMKIRQQIKKLDSPESEDNEKSE